jgi:hypothetical protein
MTTAAKSIRAREDELFAEWAAGRGRFLRDGIVDEARFERAPVRLLFLLEPADEAGDDLRRFLHGGARPGIWDDLTRWTEGIFRRALDPKGELRWSDFAHISAARRAQALRQIGAVALKASPEDAPWTRRQLGLYQADLTVCCGPAVSRHLEGLGVVAGDGWSSTVRGVRYQAAGDLGVAVDYHPPEAGVAAPLLFYGLVDAVDEATAGRGAGGR